MDRPLDGRWQLGPRPGPPRRRRKSFWRIWQTFALDEVGRTGPGQSRNHHRDALWFRSQTDAPGNVRAYSKTRLGQIAGSDGWQGVPDGWKPIFQPAGTTPGRITRNPRRADSPRNLQIEARA